MKCRFAFLLCFLSFATWAEVRTLTLRQAVDVALQQNPDLVLARLEEQKAAQAVRIAKDPFYPKVYAGSGVAYTSGFPMSVDGSGPSVIQAKAVGTIFNRSKTYAIAEARENVRTVAIDVNRQREEIALRTASLYLDAERATREADVAQRQLSSLERVVETVNARVAEGRELSIESRRADINLARARQRARVFSDEREYLEGSLAVVLGFTANDQVRPSTEARTPPEIPASENEAIEAALKSSPDIRRIESQILARGYNLRSQQAIRLPSIDLVAQYGLFAKFNNYDLYYQRFQRNNGQIGVSIQIPLLSGLAPKAAASQAEIEIIQRRAEMNNTRNRIALETRRSYQLLQEADSALQLSKQDLDLVREDLTRTLALQEEGRATLQQVEQVRASEQDKWIAYYDALAALERARLNILKQTGRLVAGIR